MTATSIRRARFGASAGGGWSMGSAPASFPCDFLFEVPSNLALAGIGARIWIATGLGALDGALISGALVLTGERT